MSPPVLPIPLSLAIVVLASGVIFSILWYLDHKTHEAIWRRDITDGELRTHRMILYASWGLQGSLLLMAVDRWLALPLFVGCWIARTMHEALDELRWHERCSERETLIHLGMWITVHSGTTAIFVWAFFYRFEGIFELPRAMWAGFLAIFAAMAFIGRRELQSHREPREADALGRQGMA